MLYTSCLHLGREVADRWRVTSDGQGLPCPCSHRHMVVRTSTNSPRSPSSLGRGPQACPRPSQKPEPCHANGRLGHRARFLICTGAAGAPMAAGSRAGSRPMKPAGRWCQSPFPGRTHASGRPLHAGGRRHGAATNWWVPSGDVLDFSHSRSEGHPRDGRTNVGVGVERSFLRGRAPSTAHLFPPRAMDKTKNGAGRRGLSWASLRSGPNCRKRFGPRDR